MAEIARHVSQLREYVHMDHPGSEEYARFVAGVGKTTRAQQALKFQVDDIEALVTERRRIDLEAKQSSELDPELRALVARLMSQWAEFLAILAASASLAKVLAPMMTHKLKISIQEYEQSAAELDRDVHEVSIWLACKPMQFFSKIFN